ncbi:hypothetical protein ACTJJ7_10755 [Phyllobacterium sp. 22229]|uniref:hypothetical protein n=1 Tax=Phyllobacterium TaxID=28100 RepID=UPI00102A1396|nr:hypothetical protein [Phyllobacterium myrsinacearum]
MAACFEFSNVFNQEKTDACSSTASLSSVLPLRADSASSGAAMLGHDFRRHERNSFNILLMPAQFRMGKEADSGGGYPSHS